MLHLEEDEWPCSETFIFLQYNQSSFIVTINDYVIDLCIFFSLCLFCFLFFFPLLIIHFFSPSFSVCFYVGSAWIFIAEQSFPLCIWGYLVFTGYDTAANAKFWTVFVCYAVKKHCCTFPNSWKTSVLLMSLDFKILSLCLNKPCWPCQ